MNYENMTRRRVLCFGDSNTYGYDPARDGRYGDDERYPMVLQDLLGDGWSVVEEGPAHRMLARQRQAGRARHRSAVHHAGVRPPDF